MMTSAEIKNLATRLSKGAVFSALHTSILLIFLMRYDYLYTIGKFQSWPLTTYLISGVLINWFLNTKNQRSPQKPLKFRKILKTTTVLIFSLVIFYIVAVLFGAPFFSAQEATLMFALLLTTLVVLPLILNLGLDATISILSTVDVFEREALNTIFSIGVRFVLFGGWLGAVVIPLDWDRPWQNWPIPCCLGALIGHVVAQLFVLCLNLNKVAHAFNQLLIRKSRKYEL